MATDQEVQDAELNRLDKNEMIAQLAILASLEAGANLKISIEAPGETSFDLKTVLAGLKTDSADAIITTLISDLDNAIQTAIGPNDSTANTIRKALKDAQTSLETNISNT